MKSECDEFTQVDTGNTHPLAKPRTLQAAWILNVEHGSTGLAGSLTWAWMPNWGSNFES